MDKQNKIVVLSWIGDDSISLFDFDMILTKYCDIGMNGRLLWVCIVCEWTVLCLMLVTL